MSPEQQQRAYEYTLPHLRHTAILISDEMWAAFKSRTNLDPNIPSMAAALGAMVEAWLAEHE